MAGNLPVATTNFETELQAKINTVGGATSIEDIISYYRAGENIPTINNTALTTEVQLRLDAVSSSTTAVEFLELAASFGKISNTNQADLQSALLAIADIPTNSELATALSPLATSAELVPLATSTDVSDSEANVISAINNQEGVVPGLILEDNSGLKSATITDSSPIVITPISGYRVILTSLITNSGNSTLTNVTISTPSEVFVNDKTLKSENGNDAQDSFMVGNYSGFDWLVTDSVGSIEYLLCSTAGESLTIETTDLDSRVVNYSYAFIKG